MEDPANLEYNIRKIKRKLKGVIASSEFNDCLVKLFEICSGRCSLLVQSRSSVQCSPKQIPPSNIFWIGSYDRNLFNCMHQPAWSWTVIFFTNCCFYLCTFFVCKCICGFISFLTSVVCNCNLTHVVDSLSGWPENKENICNIKIS